MILSALSFLWFLVRSPRSHWLCWRHLGVTPWQAWCHVQALRRAARIARELRERDRQAADAWTPPP